MGLIGGMLSSGLGQAAQNVQDISQQTIDVNNKQQLAQFQSGLEQDRATQAARLAQTIGRENTAYAATPEALAASSAVQANTIRTAATTGAEPAVLAANEAIDSAKPVQIGPMHELYQKDASGKYVLQAENKNSPYLARNEGRVGHWTAEETQQASATMTKGLEASFKTTGADGTPTVNPLAMAAAQKAFAEAQGTGSSAMQAASQGYQAAAAAVADVARVRAQRPDLKGLSDYDIYAKLQGARAQPAAATTPQPAPQPAPAKAPTATMGTPPAAPGLVKDAMTQPDDDAPIPSFAAARSQDGQAARRAARAAAAPPPVPEAAKKTEAANAFATLKPGDVRAAAKLQDSDLFEYLTNEQKRAISKIVLGH